MLPHTPHMTRLFLATSLVLQLSGVSAVTAFFCAQPAMTVQTCCCHHQAAHRQSAPRTPVAAPTCPCAMAPRGPVPVTQTPVTVSTSRTPDQAPLVPAARWSHATDGPGLLAAVHDIFADTGPPLLSVSHLRC